MFRRKKKKDEDEDKDKPLKHITVYFDEGKPITYNNPTNCTVNENIGLLHIRVKDECVVYNLRYLRAYKFEEKEGS